VIPIGDELPTLRTPWMTYLLLAITWAVWLFYERGGLDPVQLATAVCNTGLVPGELTHQAPLGTSVPLGNGMACVVDNSPINIATPILSMFLHGGWGHIIGNSLYFWIFGNNVEESMGPWRFLAFYLICGLVAAAAHIAVNPASPVPTVGASGAISGILGAYVVLFPRSRIRMYFPPIFVFWIPAVLVLLFWFFEQVIAGLPELSAMRRDVSSGVAVWAHVGGFVCGAVLIRFFADPRLVQEQLAALTQRRGLLFGR